MALLTFFFFYSLLRFYFLVYFDHSTSNKKTLRKPAFTKDKTKIIMNDGYPLNCKLKAYAKSRYFFICFHGLNGSISDFAWFANIARKNSLSFLIFEQRNFGDNTPNSSFDFKRNLIDCWTIIKLIKHQYPRAKIILLGHSLGSALITHLILLPKVRRLIYGYIFTGLVISRKVYNPFVFLEFNLKNLVRLFFGLFFNSRKVISLRTFNHNRQLGVPIRSQKKIYSTLTQRKIPLYFFTQAAYYNYRLVHNFRIFPSHIRILITKQSKDVLTDKRHLETFLQTQSRRFPHLTIVAAKDVRHTINDDHAAGIKLGHLILRWIVKLDGKKSLVKSNHRTLLNNPTEK